MYKYIPLVIFPVLIIYAILKEREESGCTQISVERQCIDENSVYIRDTIPSDTDTCEVLTRRLIDTASYHEKAGVWKRCLLISSVILLIIYIVYNINGKIDNVWHYATLLILITAVIYFYNNYLNYHHFRKLKINAEEIVKQLNSRCMK